MLLRCDQNRVRNRLYNELIEFIEFVDFEVKNHRFLMFFDLEVNELSELNEFGVPRS